MDTHFSNPLTLLSPVTLYRMKDDLLVLVKDLSKDMNDKSGREMMTMVLNDLDNIDQALEELGANPK
jgi:hypothetical protein